MLFGPGDIYTTMVLIPIGRVLFGRSRLNEAMSTMQQSPEGAIDLPNVIKCTAGALRLMV